MVWPPSARIELQPSRLAFALITLLALVTCGVIVVLPFDNAILGFAVVVVTVWAVDRLHVVALRNGPRAVRRVELRADLTLVVVKADGSASAGRLHHDSYIGAGLSTLVWRPFGRRFARAILLLPDMLPPQDFRRLRVLMRYGRSDVAQGDPASHA